MGTIHRQRNQSLQSTHEYSSILDETKTITSIWSFEASYSTFFMKQFGSIHRELAWSGNLNSSLDNIGEIKVWAPSKVKMHSTSNEWLELGFDCLNYSDVQFLHEQQPFKSQSWKNLDGLWKFHCVERLVHNILHSLHKMYVCH